MIRILFLAANPTDQLRLQSRRELDQLRHARWIYDEVAGEE